jgi:hypothetical protein
MRRRRRRVRWRRRSAVRSGGRKLLAVAYLGDVTCSDHPQTALIRPTPRRLVPVCWERLPVCGNGRLRCRHCAAWLCPGEAGPRRGRPSSCQSGAPVKLKVLCEQRAEQAQPGRAWGRPVGARIGLDVRRTICLTSQELHLVVLTGHLRWRPSERCGPG